jgi:Rps23 Pro-64 3,4-dihydroxylase Tpa1-like proline 4-hydroxylase
MTTARADQTVLLRRQGDDTVAQVSNLCVPERSSLSLTEQVRAKLLEHEVDLAAQFHLKHGPVKCRYAVLDGILPEETCHQIHAAFPSVNQMRLLDSFRERKYTSKAVDKMDPLIGEALYAFQSPLVMEIVGRITGIQDLVADPSFYAGGVSAMTPGQFLNPHLDNSHESSRRYYRRLNLLYYVTPDWQPHGGGNLELWDPGVRTPVEIPSLFNRLVIMETNRLSWHSVNTVRQAGTRCCVSNYYFTKASPEPHDYFHVTTFSGRPGQPFARAWSTVDNWLRSALRLVKRDGLARKDVYAPR